jgi:hypothetical protein
MTSGIYADVDAVIYNIYVYKIRISLLDIGICIRIMFLLTALARLFWLLSAIHILDN